MHFYRTFSRWRRALPWRRPPAAAQPGPLFLDHDGSVTPLPDLSRRWADHVTRSRLDQGIRASLRRDDLNLDDDALADAYAVCVAAFACTQYRATSLAAIPPRVVDPSGDAVGWHPLGPFTDHARTLLWQIEVDRCVYGRAYLRKHYNQDGYPTLLERLDPRHVRPVTQPDPQRGGDDALLGYWVRYNADLVPPEQIIAIGLFDPRDAHGGMAPLEVAMGQIATSRNLVRFAANFFWNSARPAGVLTSDADASEQEVARVRQEWAAGFRGVANHFKTFITNKGWKFTPVTYAPDDLAMDVLRDATNADICAAFQVYPVLVGLKNISDPLSAASTFEQVERNQTKNRTIPWLEDIFAALNAQWAWTDFDARDFFTLTPDLAAVDLLSNMTDSRVAQVDMLVNDGVLTYDEARDRVGLPTLPEGALQRDPTRALAVWQAGGCTLNECRAMLGLEPVPSGDILYITGQLVPRARLQELADITVEMAGKEPALPAGGPGAPPTFSAPTIPLVTADAANAGGDARLYLPAGGDAPAQQKAPTPPALAGMLKELNNWERCVARSTPDYAFVTKYLDAAPAVVAFIRDGLLSGQEPTAVFWIARAWLTTGERPPLPPAPTSTVVARSATGFGFWFALQDNDVVRRAQTFFREAWVDIMGIEWTRPETWHVSLCYARDPQPPGTLATFTAADYVWSSFVIPVRGPALWDDSDDGRVLVLRLSHVPALTASQRDLAAVLQAEGIALSEFSDPARYKAHVTLAYGIPDYVVIPDGFPDNLPPVKPQALELVNQGIYKRWPLGVGRASPFRQAPAEKVWPEAAPEAAHAYWKNYDALEQDLGADWLQWMAQRAPKLINDIIANPERSPDDLQALLDDAVDDLAQQWLGAADDPGPLVQLVLGGMAAGNEAIRTGEAADPNRQAARDALLREGTRQAPADLTAAVSWDVLHREAFEFAQAYTYELIGGINTTTRDAVADAVVDWLHKGGNTADLADRLQHIFTDRKRAELIAQTEGIRAYNEGTYQRYEKAGVERAVWQTVNIGLKRPQKRPGDVCHICAPLHGVEGDYRKGWVHPGGPGEAKKYKGRVYRHPAHPRCRCFSRPLIPPLSDAEFEALLNEIQPPAPPDKPRRLTATPPQEGWEAHHQRSVEWYTRGDKTTPGRGGVPVFDARATAASKNAIVEDLARRTGVSYDICDDFIRQWAQTSNDKDWRSLEIQLAAAGLFEDAALSPWQEARVAEREAQREQTRDALVEARRLALARFDDDLQTYIERNERKAREARQRQEAALAAGDEAAARKAEKIALTYEQARARLDLEAVRHGMLMDRYRRPPGARDENYSLFQDTQAFPDEDGNIPLRPDLEHVAADSYGVTQRFLQEMYHNTQEDLARQGVETIVLYRGVMLSGDEADAMRQAGVQGLADRVAFRGNALESWSIDERVAQRFAQGEVGGGEVGVVLQIEVPVSRVVGSARTGFGCLDEWEVVIHNVADGDEAMIRGVYNEYKDLVGGTAKYEESPVGSLPATPPPVGGLGDALGAGGQTLVDFLESAVDNNPEALKWVFSHPEVVAETGMKLADWMGEDETAMFMDFLKEKIKWE